MKYGENYRAEFTGMGEKFTGTVTYKRVEYGDYHTNNEGDGLWKGNTQILGTTQFSVSGCRTEKAAKAKLKKYVDNREKEYD